MSLCCSSGGSAPVGEKKGREMGEEGGGRICHAPREYIRIWMSKRAYHADDAAEHDEVEQQGGEAVQHGHHGGMHRQGLLHVGAVGEPHTQVLRVEDLRHSRKRGG